VFAAPQQNFSREAPLDRRRGSTEIAGGKQQKQAAWDKLSTAAFRRIPAFFMASARRDPGGI
jgi:hypothetical protein